MVSRCAGGIMSALRVVKSTEFDLLAVRKDFPRLHQKVHGKPLVYLDNAATTQKPKVVIEALNRFYRVDCSNVHRAVHELSDRATKAYEGARTIVKQFINARSEREIVFVRGATEAINLVANSYARSQMKAGDEILISALEHHSNIVPWQLLSEQIGARLVVAPINDAGELIVEEFERRLGPKSALVAVAHVSNALGTVMPVHEIVRIAHGRGVPVLIDGAHGDSIAVEHRTNTHRPPLRAACDAPIWSACDDESVAGVLQHQSGD
jgi:cysteine desulfurase/selenocysteine lyase